MSTTRLALALNELAAALLELTEGGGAAANPPPVTAPAAAFAQAAPREAREAGSCPIHGYPFKTTRKDGTPTRPYCSSKMDDGSWCKERPA